MLVSGIRRLALCTLHISLFLNYALTSPIQNSKRTDGQFYDFIIVGGGNAGLALAARLTESGGQTVLVLEAEQEPSLITSYKSPGADMQVLGTQIGWGFVTRPQKGLLNRVINYNRGRCLGGSTSINDFAYGRRSSSIYDLWQSLGNPGWSWDDVVSFFKKSTSLAPSTTDVRYATYETDAYSADGPVKLNYPGLFQPSSAAFVDGLAAQNITPVTVELNSVQQIIISQNGPALAATGVVYMDQNTGMVMNATANEEVILSAGTIQTPQLLMISGIGPSQELQKNGIDIMLDSPNIGANLQDHSYFSLIIRANASASSSMFNNDISKLQQSEMEYSQNKSGPLTAPAGTAFGFEKISEAELASLGASPEYISTRAKQAHVEYYYESDFYPTRPTPQYAPALNESFFSIIAGIVAPSSKGSITLQSSQIMDPPLIDPNYLTAEVDQKMAIRSFRQLRKLLTDPNLQQYALGPNYGEVVPGPSVDSDEEILDHIRTTVVTVWHASGTCAMLPRGSGGVVDSSLKVYGVERLRIVDASIIPVIPNQHTMAAVYMIAEKAAAMIKQDYGF